MITAILYNDLGTPYEVQEIEDMKFAKGSRPAAMAVKSLNGVRYYLAIGRYDSLRKVDANAFRLWRQIRQRDSWTGPIPS